MEVPTFISNRPSNLAELELGKLEKLPKTKALIVIEGPPCSGKSTAVKILCSSYRCARLVEARQDNGGVQLKAEVDAHLNRVGVDLFIVDDLDFYNKAIQSVFISSLNSSKTRCPTIITCTSMGLLNESILVETNQVYSLHITEDSKFRLASNMCSLRGIDVCPIKLKSLAQNCRDYREVHNMMQTLLLKSDGRQLDYGGALPPIVWSHILECDVDAAFQQIMFLIKQGQCLAEILNDVRDFLYRKPTNNTTPIRSIIEYINTVILKADSCGSLSIVINNFCHELCKLCSQEF
tara:strand:+ start:1071 stop:1949 length:879 start_codon:yes stop_codon:yes gene_type:complete